MTRGSPANYCFKVRKNNGTKHVRTPVKKEHIYSSVNNDLAIALVITEETNISKFTVREYFGANKAYALQNI